MALTTIKTGGLADNSVTDAKVADAITVTGAQTGITSVGTLTSFRSTGIDDNADALAVTIDSSENIGIGATSISATDWGSASPIVQISGTQPLLSFKETDATKEFQLALSGGAFYLYDADNSATRLLIADDGKVGIGTSSPATALHAESASNAVITWKSTDGSNTKTYHLANDVNRAWIGSSDTSIIQAFTPDGKVGIGTASPARDLVLYKASNPDMQFANSTTGVADGDGTILQQGGLDFYLYNQEAGDMFIGVNNSTDLTILDGGNVGIGTASPSSLLHVEATSGHENATGMVYIHKNYATNHPTLVVEQSGAGGNSGTNQGILLDVVGTAQGKSFEIQNAGTARVTVLNDGKFGIGTTSPDERLHVISDSKFDGTIRVGDGSAAAPSYRFINDVDTGIYWAGTNAMGFVTGGTSRMELRANGEAYFANNIIIPQGNVFYLDGKGSSADTYIENYQTDRVQIKAGGYGYQFYSGDAYAITGNWVDSSDERVKKNVSNLTGSLDKVNKLRPVSFKWKKSHREDERAEVGFIGQEIAKEIPEVVRINDTSSTGGYEDFHSVAYSKLVAHLVGAVQELSAEVEALKNG